MTGIGSLEQGRNYSYFPFILRHLSGVISLIILYCNSSLGVYATTTSFCAISVNAPADLTVQIKNTGTCDTAILLSPATFSGNCSANLTFETRSIFNTLTSNGGLMRFPTGKYVVIYTIRDDCGMSGTDTMNVTVYDALPPTPVCIPDLVVHLNNSGEAIIPASVFNAASHDNCGHVYFKIRRMIAPASGCRLVANPNNLFHDEVKFCCSDLNTDSLQLILRVYDIYPGTGPVADTVLRNHYADCMVMVDVVDKLAPDLYCPVNITVQCGQDLDSVLNSSRPQYSDNCSLVSLDSTIVYNLNGCGSGTITRMYTASESNGLSSTCTQVITVTPRPVFNGLDTNQLKWPSSKTFYGCGSMIDTSMAGVPIINEYQCDLVTTSYEDDVFAFSMGGVCSKIIRHWKVVNWCVYNKNLAPIPTNGYYKYDQEIKLLDSVAPVLIVIPDITTDIFSANCSMELVNIPSTSATDCGALLTSGYRFEIDLYNDGIIDRKGLGNNASGLFPTGEHRIYYFAKDLCNKEGFSFFNLKVRDAKPPLASVNYGLSTNLIQMDAGCMVSIAASRFNVSSSDNCTPEDQLRFSFSINISDSLKTFTCADSGVVQLPIYVWDLNSNYSIVNTYIVVGDNLNCCSTAGSFITAHTNISIGHSNLGLEGVRIKQISQTNEESESISNTNGIAELSCDPKCNKYELKLSKNDNFLLGISTADIIKIQKHILGVKYFEDPYEYIAADVDRNGRISASDISALRSLILGKTKSFSHGLSYAFVEKDYIFHDLESSSLDCKNHNVFIEPLKQAGTFNISAIKLGDLEDGFTNSRASSESSVNLEYKVEDGWLSFYSDESIELQAAQIGVETANDCILMDQPVYWLNEEMDAQFYSINDHHNLKLVKINQSSVSVSKGQLLCKIRMDNLSDNCLEIENIAGFQSFIIDSYDQIRFINWKSKNIISDLENQRFRVEGIQSDPFHGELNIKIWSPSDQQLNTQLFNIEGKQILTQKSLLRRGLQDITIKRRESEPDGFYFLHLDTKANNEVIKLALK